MIDKIKAEIERRIKNFSTMHNTAALKKDDEGMIRIDCALGQLRNILSFIESLEKEKPQGLDEAAKKAGLEYAPKQEGEALDANGDVYATDDVEWPSRCGFMQGFKVGAEWMAGQGVTKEAVIGMATEEISINVSEQTFGKLDLCPGDKVVVQIRKAK